MLLRLWLLFHRVRSMFTPEPQDDSADIIADMDWQNPPTDLLDGSAWDQYWMGHLQRGFGPAFLDMFLDDSMLVKVMNDRGMKRVLCAGNGISQEPKILAAAGMDVIALDISPQAADISESFQIPMGAISQYYGPGFEKPGGKVEFVTGNILDPTVCPGPFDMIIERRTSQNYLPHNGTVLTALAQRLSENGIVFSHCHNGAWRPPAKRVHFSESWFHENGWTIWDGHSGRKPSGRLAWLFLSTG